MDLGDPQDHLSLILKGCAILHGAKLTPVRGYGRANEAFGEPHSTGVGAARAFAIDVSTSADDC
jgi:hypothetical protein